MTSITTIDNLLGDVLKNVPRVTDNAALDELRAAVLRFCQETRILTESVTLTTVADQEAYPVTITTAGCTIDRVTEVKRSGFRYPEEPETYHFDFATESLVFEEDHVPPYSGDTYKVKLALAPERWAEGSPCPPWILNKWGRGIAAGAAAELLRQPGKPWSNPGLAPLIEIPWNDALSDALGETERQGTERPSYFRG
jgi:hypothetical protein